MQDSAPAVFSPAALQAMVFLAATSLIIPAFRKAKMSAVVGYLAIGVALGPHVLGRLARSLPWLSRLEIGGTGVELLSSLGVVFLLFVIGLEVSLNRLWSMRALVFGLGGGQVVLTALMVFLAARAAGLAAPAAAIAGLALALSSTAVALQVLDERGRSEGKVARAAFAVLLLQDLAVVPILFVVSALSGEAQAGSPIRLALALGGALLAIAGIAFAGRFVLRPLFRWVAAEGSREVFVATALLAVVAASASAAAAGLSMGLGAFLAGLLMSETEFRHEIETDIAPFKGLLMGLFFVTVGAQIDLGLLIAQPWPTIAAAAGLFALQTAVFAPLARLFGFSWREGVELGFLLGQAGEFAFVIVAQARGQGVFGPEIAGFLSLVVALSLAMTPFAAAVGARLGRRIEATGVGPATEDEPPPEGHVLIAGYGRVGRAIGALLERRSIPHAAIDTDAERVRDLRHAGLRISFGDASRTDMLEAMGAGAARAIVVTVDEPEAAERIVAGSKRSWPDVPVYVRARDASQARRLHAIGAEMATPDTVETTLAMAEALLRDLGVPSSAVQRIVDAERDAETKRIYADRD